MREDLDFTRVPAGWESSLLIDELENLFSPLRADNPGRRGNIFNFTLDPQLLSVEKRAIYANSDYMRANHFSPCLQIYEGHPDEYNSKNSPLLIARTIEQQQRRLIQRGRQVDWDMCHLIQVVLSCDAQNDDFDQAASSVANFRIDMPMDFLRRPLLHLLIIDIYNKRSRCAEEVNRLHPNLRVVQRQRLQHMLELGADVNVGGTVKGYNALQIAVYLNLWDIVADLLQYSEHSPNLHVCSSEKGSTLFELLISGYYFRDPQSPAGPISLTTDNCISDFLICLAHISGRGSVHGRRTCNTDPIHAKDVKNNSVMDYLQGLYRLSNNYPYDFGVVYADKQLILRDLFFVLQDIVTVRENIRVRGILTHNLHSKEWERPVPEEIRRRLIREGKRGENEEYFIRGEMVQRYREHMELHDIEEQLMSLYLNPPATALSVQLGSHAALVQTSTDRLHALRDHALGTYTAITRIVVRPT